MAIPHFFERNETRYEYATGFATWDAAREAVDDYYATGEILPGERPDIERRGKTWAVTIGYTVI